MSICGRKERTIAPTKARRPSERAKRRRRHAIRRVGARRAAKCRSSAISTAGGLALNPMHSVRSSGIWECFIPGIGQGAVTSTPSPRASHDYAVEKADPYGFAAEIRPHTASKVWDLSGYEWGDKEWMARRGRLKHSMRRCPFTKSISAPGGAFRSKAIAG